MLAGYAAIRKKIEMFVRVPADGLNVKPMAPDADISIEQNLSALDSLARAMLPRSG